MKAILIEGTPEEIVHVINTMRPFAKGEIVPVARPVRADTEPAPGDGGAEKPVTVEFARLVLRRRPLSANVKTVLKALAEAEPEYLTTKKLQEAVGFQNGHQLAGLMGAFGRRMVGTAGYDEEAWFFVIRWNESASAWEYRLVETAIEALKKEGLA